MSLPAGIMDELELNSSMTPAGSDTGDYYQML
jgi:hypothetical protein